MSAFCCWGRQPGMGWVSKQETLFMPLHTGSWRLRLSPLRILVISLFLLLLGSESRVGWQEGRMSPHSFSLVWAWQSTPPPFVERLHLGFSKIYTLLLRGLSALSSLWAPDPKMLSVHAWRMLNHDQQAFDQCLINCKSRVSEMKDFPHVLWFCSP